jgi:hypothetical protein
MASADRVIDQRSSWNPSRTRIYSDVTVERDDGSRYVRRVPGGVVDGIGMIQYQLGVGGPLHDPIIAFVNERNKFDKVLHWSGSCVFVTPDADGTTDLPGTEETTILGEVLEVWNSATTGCGYLELRLDPPAAGHEVGYDGVNLVKYRHETWCSPPGEGETEPNCYDPGAFAITTLFYVEQEGRGDDGTILDSDIEMNAVNFAIATDCDTTCRTEGSGPLGDLANTMTHEVGHLLGLDHTCWEGSSADAPLDDEGNPAPSCNPVSSLSSEILDATMYNYENPGEISKRTPEPDDIAGVCSLYPTADDPDVCERVSVDGDGCCSVAGGTARSRGGAAGTILLALAALSALICSRNRRR